jgi:hypothetical protein
MKKSILCALLLATSICNAQKNKPVLQTQLAPLNFSSKVLGLNAGLTNGAVNVGATYDSGKETGSLGGYFFLQTEKKANDQFLIHNTMAVGAHTHLNILSQNEWTLSLKPGVGIAIVKEISVSSSGSKSDATLIGPSLRWSVTHKLGSNNEVGIETLQFWNLFNSDSGAPTSGELLTFVFKMAI